MLDNDSQDDEQLNQDAPDEEAKIDSSLQNQID